MIPGKQYTLDDIQQILRRRKWLIVLPFLIVSTATFFAVRALPDLYRSETLILVVPQRVPESYVRSTVTARIEDRLQSISQQILSRTRLERIIDDFGLYSAERKSKLTEEVVQQMRDNIDVQLVKGDAFRVAFTDRDPQVAMKVTERLASLFIEENLRDREVLAEGSYEFLDSQLDEARRQLVEQEKRLEEYRRKYAGQLPSQAESNMQVIQNTQMRIQALTESMARDRDRILILERAIADAGQPETPAAAVPVPASGDAQESASRGTAAQQLDAARRALEQLQLRLKPEHPDVVRMKRTVTRLEQLAAAENDAARPAVPSSDAVSPRAIAARNRLNELTTELADLKRQLSSKEQEERQLHRTVGEYQARVEASPTRESELISLTRDYDTMQKSYTNLLAKKQESKVAANLERRQIGEQFKILDPARVPQKPESPNRPRLNAMGAALGFGLGLALVVLLELTDSTLKTDDDVLTALSLPVLALVPMMTTTFERKRIERRRRRLIVALASSATVLAAAALIIWKIRY